MKNVLSNLVARSLLVGTTMPFIVLISSPRSKPVPWLVIKNKACGIGPLCICYLHEITEDTRRCRHNDNCCKYGDHYRGQIQESTSLILNYTPYASSYPEQDIWTLRCRFYETSKKEKSNKQIKSRR